MIGILKKIRIKIQINEYARLRQQLNNMILEGEVGLQEGFLGIDIITGGIYELSQGRQFLFACNAHKVFHCNMVRWGDRRHVCYKAITDWVRDEPGIDQLMLELVQIKLRPE